MILLTSDAGNYDGEYAANVLAPEGDATVSVNIDA